MIWIQWKGLNYHHCPGHPAIPGVEWGHLEVLLVRAQVAGGRIWWRMVSGQSHLSHGGPVVDTDRAGKILQRLLACHQWNIFHKCYLASFLMDVPYSHPPYHHQNQRKRTMQFNVILQCISSACAHSSNRCGGWPARLLLQTDRSVFWKHQWPTPRVTRRWLWFH